MGLISIGGITRVCVFARRDEIRSIARCSTPFDGGAKRRCMISELRIRMQQCVRASTRVNGKSVQSVQHSILNVNENYYS